MTDPKNTIVSAMLDRLFASMVSGPSMNCRPHNSRQRIDLSTFDRLRDIDVSRMVSELLGSDGKTVISAKATAPSRSTQKRVDIASEADGDGEEELTADEKKILKDWRDQQALMSKVRVIADDARTYEQDTGVHALNVGFPLLHLPPGSFSAAGAASTRRILAPIAFIPITLSVKSGTKPSVQIECRGEGVDRIIPNIALLAWLEKQTGKQLIDLFADETGEEPWKEIASLVKAVQGCVETRCDGWIQAGDPQAVPTIEPVPRSDSDDIHPVILASAVLGLFPASNQGLIRDTNEILAGGAPDGPIESFVKFGFNLDVAVAAEHSDERPLGTPQPRAFSRERLVSHADPCQTRAVRMAQTARGLVVHGPPGTGKSQTIANMIGDHLARGERVLFVCDKRTALDVVSDRLSSIGLADLCATVHDPQRDQREFYKSVREQLENLAEVVIPAGATARLDRIDSQLQTLHDDLRGYYERLNLPQNGSISFHQLVGHWLTENVEIPVNLDDNALHEVSASTFDGAIARLREVLERAQALDYENNPWREATKPSLLEFSLRPMDDYREAARKATAAAVAVDAISAVELPAFSMETPLEAQGNALAAFSKVLERVSAASPQTAHRWLTASPEKIEQKRADVKAGLRLIDDLKMDHGLAHKLPPRTTSETLAAHSQAVTEYQWAFTKGASRLGAVRQIYPDVSTPTFVRWLISDTALANTVFKKLEAIKPIADQIRSTPLDTALNARLAASPIGASQRIQWLGDLATYLESADKLLGFLAGGAKKAAQPVVRHFGLPLSESSASAVHTFLSGIQLREDFRIAMTNAGVEANELADDADLLAAYDSNVATLRVMRNPSHISTTTSNESYAPAIRDAVNGTLGATRDSAQSALAPYGLALDPSSGPIFATFASAAAARLIFKETLLSLGIVMPSDGLPSDDKLLAGGNEALTVLDMAEHCPRVPVCDKQVLQAFESEERRTSIVKAFRNAPLRCSSIAAFEKATSELGLLSELAQHRLAELGRQGAHVQGGLARFVDRLDDIEGVLRISEGLRKLPAALAEAATRCIHGKVEPKNALSAMRRRVIEGEIRRRVRADPTLNEIDSHRLDAAFAKFRELSESKKSAVLDVIKEKWVGKQRGRLLSSTMTRLNSEATDLRRRLTTRGERAMRLRQVIAHGRTAPGGDPLFDLRPVWMASPETVSQLFPREAIFDVIIFDEASQCRLEEALPVLTRGKRVVIAGDPKQLPPTRFFESAVSTSEDTTAETEQELFEAQQSEVEDLLTAALGSELMQRSYLDVHYRSRNEDLIGFSNEHFYNSRLQAVPGHPRNRIGTTPVSMHRADGIYDKRRNVLEAEKVCELVRELLSSPKPPSIGIACFNLTQRDLIVEKLEELAEEDSDFADKLAIARERRGADSFEGLFVKNLENVQGDERDHIIVSTTYGPNPNGKFRRSFGPVGSSGGGRRLNVLVTRARDHLHVVTSIPRSEFASLPPIPSGASPGGAWLLFAYLRFVETLAEDYATARRILDSSTPEELATVTTKPSRNPSQFAKAIGGWLHGTAKVGSDVHWGNEGFMVDVAVHHPKRFEDVTIGILCDMNRYSGTDDPIEWEVFRTGIHERQGWKLHRIWSPHFFRDPSKALKAIRDDIDLQLRAEA